MVNKARTLAKPGKEQLLVKRGTKTINEALADMKSGSRAGFLGENLVRKPDYQPEPENLDADGKTRKQVVTNLLMRVIEPNQLSSKSTVEMDRRSLYNKLKKSSFDELKRLLPEQINSLSTEELKKLADGSEEITDGDKAEIQDLYKEISP